MRGAGQRKLRAPAMRWALATAAPWALATGMLVSFTASAGQPNDVAISLQARAEPDVSSDVALGPSLLTVASAFNLPALSLSDALVGGRYEQARLSVEEPARLVPMNERRPRADLKPNVAHFPELDRSRKSDPLLSLRPSLSQRQQPWSRAISIASCSMAAMAAFPPASCRMAARFRKNHNGLNHNGLSLSRLSHPRPCPIRCSRRACPRRTAAMPRPRQRATSRPAHSPHRRATPVLPSAVWKALMAPRQ